MRSRLSACLKFACHNIPWTKVKSTTAVTKYCELSYNTNMTSENVRCRYTILKKIYFLKYVSQGKRTKDNDLT
jgi:hypothetical protein